MGTDERGNTPEYNDHFVHVVDNAIAICNREWPGADSPASTLQTAKVIMRQGIATIESFRTENENLKAEVAAGQAASIRMAQELATAEARVRDEVERECIKSVCVWCDQLLIPFPRRNHEGQWDHPRPLLDEPSCEAEAIWEIRYQRQAEGGGDGES